jgi:hypothetical protein
VSQQSSSLRFAVAFLFAAFAVAALAFADAGARAQNSNTNTAAEDSTQNANTNTTTRRGRGRRGRRGSNANANAGDANANANTGDATTTTTDTGTGSGTGTGAGAGTGAGMTQDEDMPRDLSGERVDLSGNYTGHVTMSGAHEMDAEGTLTITGNQFTLASEGMTHNGRVYAVVTRGYIGAAFYFSDITDPTTNTPVVANVRARKTGERLTLTPVPNTRTRLTFGTAGRRGRARRGAAPTTDANSNTGDNSNTTPPM